MNPDSKYSRPKDNIGRAYTYTDNRKALEIKDFKSFSFHLSYFSILRWEHDGEGGIRTHVPISGQPDFESGPL